MAEEAPEVNPVKEARRMVNMYLSELGWSREKKRTVERQLIPAVEKNPKIRDAEEVELMADEHFGAQLDKWREERSKTSWLVLTEVVKLLGKRNDLSVFGKRMINRIKEELLL